MIELAKVFFLEVKEKFDEKDLKIKRLILTDKRILANS